MEKVDISFSDFLGELKKIGKDDWITVYSSYKDNLDWTVFYCALISDTRVKNSLKGPSWDLTIGSDRPGFSFSSVNGKWKGSYYKYSHEGIEPLVTVRNFNGIKSGYCEILEEFRYYFNLYEDKINKKYIFIDDNGDEEDAVRISDKKVEIKLRLIKEF